MPLHVSILVPGVDAMTDLIDRVTLHTGDPGTTGAHEHPATGSPAYAAQTPAFGAAVAVSTTAVSALGAALVFNVYDEIITHVGLWTTAGLIWRGGQVLPIPRDFTGVQDVLTLDTLTISLP